MKYFVLLTMMLVSCTTFAVSSDRLITALITVESNGNDKASGDNGNAIGCLQLWDSYVQDACWNGKTFKSSDRYNRQKSIEIFRSFMNRYATDSRLQSIRNELSILEKRPLVDISNDEIICRMHNGGLGFCFRTKKEKEKSDFSGRNRRIVNTAYYWSKIKLIINK